MGEMFGEFWGVIVVIVQYKYISLCSQVKLGERGLQGQMTYLCSLPVLSPSINYVFL